MNKNENGFSLVIVVIFMSIAALFIGYLMGSWLISFLVEDDSTEIAEQEQNTPNVSQELQQNDEQTSEPEDINNTENNLTAPTEEELKIAPEQNNQEVAEETANPDQNQSGQPAEENEVSSQDSEIAGDFGVQIGAFSNYNNALSVKKEVEDLGYEVVVTEASPHQVQVTGYQTREDAEAAAKKLEAEGYPGFIVIRE
ncbi:sporulation related protein [Halanaerobium saccharolyticum]|uniref:Sporulation related protein n=1 Tax=Halanaerobium saccharolyticum TaxID=43595 RepID=A0A4R6LFK8_9FIRM|nr:SPOR domain-containing protein [Halanaerobium saccharolyticum]TDO78296.1 sporulation related protein [Halanaerobium saccharolyticum]